MALSEIRFLPLGPGVQAVYGKYTHTVAAASESLVVTGGRILALVINPQTSANGQTDAFPAAYSTSTTGALTTVTFLQNAPVTSGTFFLLVGLGV